MTAPIEHGGRTADEVWAPITFKVGDRVRVKVNPECRIKGNPGSVVHRKGRRGHLPGENGLTGTVTEVGGRCGSLSLQGHPYEVHFDGGILDLGEGVSGCCVNYAAIELIPIGDPSVPHDGRDGTATDAAGEEQGS